MKVVCFPDYLLVSVYLNNIAADTRRINVGRRRRWTNAKRTLIQRIVSDGIVILLMAVLRLLHS